MGFDRERLPDPVSFYESQGLRLIGRGKWRTTSCGFHGGHDSMRVNLSSGGWCCMNCGAKGGDILSYHMQAHGLEFTEAAKSLGAWMDDGKPGPTKPASLTPRQALEVLSTEANLAAIAAANVARGVVLSDVDLARLLSAAHRIARLAEDYA